jgi:hypothetical protein
MITLDGCDQNVTLCFKTRKVWSGIEKRRIGKVSASHHSKAEREKRGDEPLPFKWLGYGHRTLSRHFGVTLK